MLASRAGGAWSYYSVDGLGSVTAVTDATGSVTRRLTYDTFGALQGAAANETYAFTGHQFEFGYRAVLRPGALLRPGDRPVHQ